MKEDRKLRTESNSFIFPGLMLTGKGSFLCK